MTGQGSVEDIADRLSLSIQNSAMSCKLVTSVRRQMGEVALHMLVFDKYYLRNSSRTSLTVTVFGMDDQVVIDVVGSGGSQGAVFNFSWGAEENFVETVRQILTGYGFK